MSDAPHERDAHPTAAPPQVVEEIGSGARIIEGLHEAVLHAKIVRLARDTFLKHIPNRDAFTPREVVTASEEIARQIAALLPKPEAVGDGDAGWRPISEAEPPPGRVVLLAYHRDDPGDWIIASGHRGAPKNDRWDDDAYTPWRMDGRSLKAWDHLPTYWRPLPPPPDGSDAEGGR